MLIRDVVRPQALEIFSNGELSSRMVRLLAFLFCSFYVEKKLVRMKESGWMISMSSVFSALGLIISIRLTCNMAMHVSLSATG